MVPKKVLKKVLPKPKEGSLRLFPFLPDFIVDVGLVLSKYKDPVHDLTN